MSETQTVPTAAAMRTAKAIVRIGAWPCDLEHKLAEIIDRETGLPDLLKACEGILPLLDAELHPVEPWRADVEAIRAAVAKAKGTE